MISRIDGSRIKRFEQKEFDEDRALVKGSLPGFDEEGARLPNTEAALSDENSIRLEGRVWRLTYELPKNRDPGSAGHNRITQGVSQPIADEAWWIHGHGQYLRTINGTWQHTSPVRKATCTFPRWPWG